MKLWVGKEQEGKYIGTYTLFVCGKDTTFTELKVAVRKHNAVKQIYFGAGICSEFDTDTIYKCCRTYPDKIISVEIRLDNLKDFSTYLLKKENLNLIITFDDENKRLVYLNPNKVQFKLQCLKNGGRMIAMSNLNEFSLVDTTKLRNKIYAGDKKIK